MIEFPPEQIRQKGPSSAGPDVPGRHRRGPDRRRQRDQGQDRPAEALSPLAGGEPHRAARAVPAVAAAGEPIRETLAQRLRAFGYTREELRDDPRADGAPTARSRSARWAPTRRWRCSRDRPKLLFNYFKQLFAQVTNPPIDPLREGLVMSLMAFTGKQRNLLDETPEHCRQLKLPHPILTNEDMERLRAVKRERFQGGDAAGAVRRGRGRPRRSAAARPGANWSTRPRRRSARGRRC